ncbi:MAG TPA: MFS transporter, partial [Polyangia bacterium]|nr:MFS transporter [Polyangia bacterium]
MNPPELDRARLFTPAFVALLTLQFACGLSLSVFFLLPKILVSRLHAGPFEVGLVSGSFGLAAVAVIPLVAWRIDHVRRVPMLRAATVILIVTSLGFLLVQRAGILAVALRGAQGVAWALVYCAGSALVSEMAPRERLAQTIGVWGSANLVTSAIAPAFAEPMIDYLGPASAFLMAAVAAAIGLGFTRRIQETRRGTSGLHVRGILTVLRRPSTMRMLLVLVIAGIAYGAMFTFHQPMALQLGITSVRGFFIWYTLGALGVRLGLGGMIDRVGPLRMSIVALVGYTIVVVGMRNLDGGTLSLYGGLFGVAH